jgi:hypothetical protein
MKERKSRYSVRDLEPIMMPRERFHCHHDEGSISQTLRYIVKRLNFPRVFATVTCSFSTTFYKSYLIQILSGAYAQPTRLL